MITGDIKQKVDARMADILEQWFYPAIGNL